jgi:hypothetical protein
MGKVVITCDKYAKIYKEQYGVNVPFLIAHTPKELRKQVDYVRELSVSNLRTLQEKHRQFVVDYHSHEATGNRLKELFIELWPEQFRNL